MMRRARSSLNWLSCQATTVRFIPSKLRCIWSTPMDMRFTMERDFECLARAGRRAGMGLFDAHREAIYGHEFRSAPIVPVLLVACFAQDLVQRSHVGARAKKLTDGVADVAAGFPFGQAAARPDR